jgi:sugar transferase (PEP-CTERM/EpsH1 system associated)
MDPVCWSLSDEVCLDMSRPLIVHILYRLDYGGLENGLVNLINGLPTGKYRHAVICLTGYTDFCQRIHRPDVEIYDLDKKPGKDFAAYVRLWWLLLRLRPNAVHTRNTGTIDCAIVAFFAAVRVRLHGCHGWDVDDLRGSNPRGRRLRRLCHPFISGYMTVSRDLRKWLITTDGVDPERVVQTYNGVDCERFRPGRSETEPVFASDGPKLFVIGTVGRLDRVKDPLTLAQAFVTLVKRDVRYREYVRLAIVGDGMMRDEIETVIAAAGLEPYGCVLGWRDDVGDVLRQFDVFCLPSLNEGISNTLLEAMATGLPIVATAVGGNTELIAEGQTGFLVEPGDAEHIADVLEKYLNSNELVCKHGREARHRAEANFSLRVMLREYDSFYARYLLPAGAPGN